MLVHTSYLFVTDITCLAFLKHSWLLGPWVSLSSWSGIRELPARSHYFPELAPICRMSGLMGSDVKIYHNLQFPRPPPLLLVMMLLARAGSLSWPTEWMNGQLWVAERGRGGGGGCFPGAGGNHGHLVIRARITQSWPRNKHQPQTKLCYTLKPMKWLVSL